MGIPTAAISGIFGGIDRHNGDSEDPVQGGRAEAAPVNPKIQEYRSFLQTVESARYSELIRSRSYIKAVQTMLTALGFPPAD